MASLSFFFLLTLSTWVLLISPIDSLNCTSQNFTNNKLYANCSDLPTLNSYLHYTYNASNSSLSIAFVAPPAKPEGWTAWAINPNGTGMIGAQALIALKSNGTLTVKPYNLVSYMGIVQTNLSFDVWDVSAEANSSTGNFIIFASVKVPKAAESVNQVWQVGPSVSDGIPVRHDIAAANLQAKGTLALASTVAGGNTSTAGGSGTNGTAGAGCRIRELNAGFYLGVFALVACVLG